MDIDPWLLAGRCIGCWLAGHLIVIWLFACYDLYHGTHYVQHMIETR